MFNQLTGFSFRARPVLSESGRAKRLRNENSTADVLQWSPSGIKTDAAVVAYLNAYCERHECAPKRARPRRDCPAPLTTARSAAQGFRPPALGRIALRDLQDLDGPDLWNDPDLAVVRAEVPGLQRLSQTEFSMRASVIVAANLSVLKVRRASVHRGLGCAHRRSYPHAWARGLAAAWLPNTAPQLFACLTQASYLLTETVGELLRTHKASPSRASRGTVRCGVLTGPRVGRRGV